MIFSSSFRCKKKNVSRTPIAVGLARFAALTRDVSKVLCASMVLRRLTTIVITLMSVTLDVATRSKNTARGPSFVTQSVNKIVIVICSIRPQAKMYPAAAMVGVQIL